MPLNGRPLCSEVFHLTRLISGRPLLGRLLEFQGDGPKEAEQFSCHRRDDLLFGQAATEQALVATMEAALRLPCDLLHRFWQAALALAQSKPERGPVAVRPARFDDDSAQVSALRVFTDPQRNLRHCESEPVTSS